VTLPDKYYNLEAHERMLRSIANGDTLPGDEGIYDFRLDEADISRRARAAAVPTSKNEDHLTYEAVSVDHCGAESTLWEVFLTGSSHSLSLFTAPRTPPHPAGAGRGHTAQEAGSPREGVVGGECQTRLRDGARLTGHATLKVRYE